MYLSIVSDDLSRIVATNEVETTEQIESPRILIP